MLNIPINYSYCYVTADVAEEKPDTDLGIIVNNELTL